MDTRAELLEKSPSADVPQSPASPTETDDAPTGDYDTEADDEYVARILGDHSYDMDYFNHKTYTFVLGLVAIVVYTVAMSSNTWIRWTEDTGEWEEGLWKICHDLRRGSRECSVVSLNFKGDWPVPRVLMCAAMLLFAWAVILHLKDIRTGPLNRSTLWGAAAWLLTGIDLGGAACAFLKNEKLRNHVAWGYWTNVASAILCALTALCYTVASYVSAKNHETKRRTKPQRYSWYRA